MRFVIVVLMNICLLCSTPLFALSSETGLHLDWLDKSVDPAVNFFAYANGNWQKQNPVPATYSRWGMFHLLHEKNQQTIKTMIESIAEHHQLAGSIEQKVGDFYFSGMDEATINKVGVTPLQPEFKRIEEIKTLSELQTAVTHLQMIGVDVLFNFGQMQDFKDSRQVIGVAAQGGIGLPDRDYYLKDEKKFQQIREAYLQHISRMFVLLGDDAGQAMMEAKTVLRIETELAKANMSRIAMRDPRAMYHLTTINKLEKITPHFSWKNYFAGMGHPEVTYINLATPHFFKVLDQQLTQVSLQNWKVYLRWNVIHAFAPFLSTPFVNENFRMVSTLTGIKELLPRWQRIINAEDGALGFAIGKLYVEKVFPPSSKQQVQDLAQQIRSTLRNKLQHLKWMTASTRRAAIVKLDMMEDRIGYPDTWWDYSTLHLDKGPYILNVIRANEFLNKRSLNKIGKPVDKNEWEMTPQTVNAYYDPAMNRLNIPAGILQSPFFDPKVPAAINYGAIGFVIGHEITHGFDDQGSKFDGHGNLKNWWSKEDWDKFQQTTQHIAKQFSQYVVNKNVHVQGDLVVGEATADLGGLILAYDAFHQSTDYQHAQKVDGFTPDQQFFLGAAHIWADNIRPEEIDRLIMVDPHPPAIYRVNGTLANMPQFQLAFGIKNGSPMVNKKRYEIW